jgi:chlorite dismutase
MNDTQSPPIPIEEVGADGRRSDRRLFMQLHVFTDCTETAFAIETLQQAGMAGVVYDSLADPFGIGLLTFSEDPEHFTGPVRRLIKGEPFVRMTLRHEMTMFGRTYAIGYEPNLDDVLIHRPVGHVLDEHYPWAVWYPLRRSPEFAQLPVDTQRAMLAEHGRIGKSFGQAGYAHDVRLAAHGLNQDDQDFIVGLVGAELGPLSKLVEAMRPTQQTARYIQHMGPFFVGRAVWQSAGQ